VDLRRDIARLPLHPARIWKTAPYVITDVSDRDLARRPGRNSRPRQANVIPPDCPACVQAVASLRELGRPGVSRMSGTRIVYNAPIVATGPNRFDTLLNRKGQDPRNGDVLRALRRVGNGNNVIARRPQLRSDRASQLPGAVLPARLARQRRDASGPVLTASSGTSARRTAL
jgi:hypothetical protein